MLIFLFSFFSMGKICANSMTSVCFVIECTEKNTNYFMIHDIYSKDSMFVFFAKRKGKKRKAEADTE